MVFGSVSIYLFIPFPVMINYLIEGDLKLMAYVNFRYLGWLGFASYLTVGVGILNDWDITSKEVPTAPSTKDTKVR